MKYGNLVLEKKEFLMIKKYQELHRILEDYLHKDIMESLNQNMCDALVLDAEGMPSDVVRMYSHVTVKCASEWRDTIQLVAPSEEDLGNNRISVVSSLGASLIGRSVGDRITYGLPGSSMSLLLEDIDQGVERVVFTLSEDILEKIFPAQSRNSLTLNK